MKWTILADSSCDLKDGDIKSTKTTFATVPLIITINNEDFVDDEKLDTRLLVSAMKANKSAPLTACPSPESFAQKMREGGENIFCVTVTSKLSGCYNSASLAAKQVMEEDKNKKIYVVDSLATSGTMILLVQKLVALIEEEKLSFEQIVEEINKMRDNTRLRFLLHELGNLVKTGRLSRVKGIIASALNIKLVLGENGEGEICEVGKTIGTRKALAILSECPAARIKEMGPDMPVAISHCHNEEDAKILKDFLIQKYGLTNVKIYPMRGLCCFYANYRGLILGY